MLEVIPTHNLLAIVLAMTLLIGGGFLASRLAHRQGLWQQQTVQEVDHVLRQLAAATGGRFVPGQLMYEHPTLGGLYNYGTTYLERHGLAVEVTVHYPADSLLDDRTSIRVRLPGARTWRAPPFEMRHAPAVNADFTREATLTRAFSGIAANTLPIHVRERLLALASKALVLQLTAEELRFVPSVPATWVGVAYIKDPVELQRLVEETSAVAEQLHQLRL